MSHSNMCAAYGCPMPGVVSTSTAGTHSWLCGFHVNRDATAWPKITTELNRLRWLVDICHGVRVHRDTDRWPTVYRRIQADIVSHQRSDLLLSEADGKSVSAWLARMEGELLRATSQHLQQRQDMLAKPAPPAETWQRAQFAAP